MCAIAAKYRLQFVTPEDHEKRAVAFLISNNVKVTANGAFKRLDRDGRLWLQKRFEYWVGRYPPNKKWFHGWDRSEFEGKYTKCFVFKYKDNRFYGFLCNPKSANPAYRVCVLAIHACKGEYETYEPDLRKVEELRALPIIKSTIENHFRGKP